MLYNYPLLGGFAFFILLLITRGFKYPCHCLPSQIKATQLMLAQLTTRFNDNNLSYILTENTILTLDDVNHLEIHLPFEQCQRTIDLFTTDVILKTFKKSCLSNCSRLRVYHAVTRNPTWKLFYKKLFFELIFKNSSFSKRTQWPGYGFLYYGPPNTYEVEEIIKQTIEPCTILIVFIEVFIGVSWLSTFCRSTSFHAVAVDCIAHTCIPIFILFLIICGIELTFPFE
jgi:hypothetical protein